MKLLIVEDDLMMGAGLQAALTNAGFDAHWVTDGQAAFELLTQSFFRVAVLDISLPGLDGMALLKNHRHGRADCALAGADGGGRASHFARPTCTMPA